MNGPALHGSLLLWTGSVHHGGAHTIRGAMRPIVLSISLAMLLLAPAGLAAQQAATTPAAEPQPTTAAQAPNSDTSYIDDHGSAHVTRVVPVPKALSPQAQLMLGHAIPDQGPPQSLADRRKMTDEYTTRARAAWSRLCPNQLVD